MPFNRSYRKKSSYGRRRNYRKRGYKRSGTMRRSRKGYTVYRFKRSGDTLYESTIGTSKSTIVESGLSTGTVYNFAFLPSLLPNFSEFQALYDQYKVKALKVSFIPMSNISSFTAVTGATGPAGAYSVRSYTSLDFNYDTSPVTTVSGMREYQNMKWKPYSRIHSRYFYPRINSSNTINGYTLKQQPWLNTADPNRSHYGLNFAVDVTNAPVGTVLYKIEIKAYLAFKTPK